MTGEGIQGARRWGLGPWLLAALLPVVAGAQGVRQERADVQQRLSAERQALAHLAGQKVDTLELVALLERLSEGATARARTLDTQLRALQRQVELTERQEAVARAARQAQIERLGPRLRAMYRLMRQNPLAELLSARDFSGLVWRSRAMARIVEGDLLLLESIQRTARFQQAAAAKLSTLREALADRVVFIRQEAERAERERRDLADLANLLAAQQVQGGRAVRELEQANRELSSLINEMERALPTSGFGALRGKLPLPTQGMVEAGYGKVVNPRFNTVTVRKGLDVRAPPGTPVRAVAAGKAVYSGWLRGYGNLLILDHGDGFHTLVAHLAKLSRAVGEQVKAGDELGTVGDTGSLKGAYVYFEVRHLGQAVDPSIWLAGSAPVP